MFEPGARRVLPILFLAAYTMPPYIYAVVSLFALFWREKTAKKMKKSWI
jgi:hypothetical protein